MTSGRVFIDSNVLLYTISRDPRAARATEVLAQGDVISVQVLNEFANTARRKMALDFDEIRDTLDRFRSLFAVEPLTVDTHLRALDIAQRYGFSIYDALIVASAIGAGCDTLLSEDMQHGQHIGNTLRIVNPFLAAA